jgi:predicted transposase/invertase (TIGR01784 family)
MHFEVFRHIKGMRNLYMRRRFHKELRRPAGKKAAKSEILNVMEDLVFKAMLTTDSDVSREALRSLLSVCTRRPVAHVQVTNNDLTPAHIGGKPVRVDVHVIFNDGEVADLEMQTYRTNDDLKRRSELYTAMLLSGQSQEGHKYKEIKRVYQIFFLDCIIFPNSDKLPQRFSYREETEHFLLDDASAIIFYELPRLDQKVQDLIAGTGRVTTNDLSEEEKWCIFMRYRHEQRAEKLVKRLYREEEGIMLAERAVNGISREYLEYARKMSETKARWEQELLMDKAQAEGLAKGMAKGMAEGMAKGMEKGMAKGMAQGLEKGMAQGLEKGLEKGLAQGRTDEKLELAQKLKARGRPLEEIAEDTGLSLEEVSSI